MGQGRETYVKSVFSFCYIICYIILGLSVVYTTSIPAFFQHSSIFSAFQHSSISALLSALQHFFSIPAFQHFSIPALFFVNTFLFSFCLVDFCLSWQVGVLMVSPLNFHISGIIYLMEEGWRCWRKEVEEGGGGVEDLLEE